MDGGTSGPERGESLSSFVADFLANLSHWQAAGLVACIASGLTLTLGWWDY
jgi:hypothetical protein